MKDNRKLFQKIENELDMKGFTRLVKTIIRQDGKTFVNPDLAGKKTKDKINIDNIIIEFC